MLGGRAVVPARLAHCTSAPARRAPRRAGDLPPSTTVMSGADDRFPNTTNLRGAAPVCPSAHNVPTQALASLRGW
jgi:hypothetical protein